MNNIPWDIIETIMEFSEIFDCVVLSKVAKPYRQTFLLRNYPLHILPVLKPAYVEHRNKLTQFPAHEVCIKTCDLRYRSRLFSDQYAHDPCTCAVEEKMIMMLLLKHGTKGYRWSGLKKLPSHVPRLHAPHKWDGTFTVFIVENTCAIKNKCHSVWITTGEKKHTTCIFIPDPKSNKRRHNVTF